MPGRLIPALLVTVSPAKTLQHQGHDYPGADIPHLDWPRALLRTSSARLPIGMTEANACALWRNNARGINLNMRCVLCRAILRRSWPERLEARQSLEEGMQAERMPGGIHRLPGNAAQPSSQ